MAAPEAELTEQELRGLLRFFALKRERKQTKGESQYEG
jgi:hypothetical protein